MEVEATSSNAVAISRGESPTEGERFLPRKPGLKNPGILFFNAKTQRRKGATRIESL
jgi:hypothetical protein